jgi:VRR-NUC domain
MRRAALRRLPAGVPTDEKSWQAEVVDIATTCGWQRRYHTFDSRRSTPGFPDLTLVRPPRLIFAEIKTERGRVTRDQWGWLADLVACGAECYVWRPSDRADVDMVLASRSRIPWLEVST